MTCDFRQIEWDDSCREDCRQIARWAIREDFGRAYDWTTLALVPSETPGCADVVVRTDGVLAGLPAADEVLHEFDPHIVWQPRAEDGRPVAAGPTVARVSGSARSLLAAERTLLNFLGRLSGIATLTARFVSAVAGTKARIYDTRKTTPPWRRLEKYAVRQGGGWNHRLNLYEAVLIKDNHLAIAQAGAGGKSHGGLSPAEAVHRTRLFLEQLAADSSGALVDASGLLVEVEVESPAQFADALDAAPDLILLDNFSPVELRAAVELRDRCATDVELEASGGVSLATVREIAQTGVDRISAGALTHSAAWLDVALDWRTA